MAADIGNYLFQIVHIFGMHDVIHKQCYNNHLEVPT